MTDDGLCPGCSGDCPACGRHIGALDWQDRAQTAEAEVARMRATVPPELAQWQLKYAKLEAELAVVDDDRADLVNLLRKLAATFGATNWTEAVDFAIEAKAEVARLEAEVKRLREALQELYDQLT